MTPSERLKALRKAYAVTLYDLSTAIQVDRANLSKMEHGKMNIGPKVGGRLAAYFGISPLLFSKDAVAVKLATRRGRKVHA